jgi:hypothetical protein
MTDRFRFLMISAMYENGGNTTQRLLDGHPELYSYPFESQLGTRYVSDYLSGLYPAKYRWPVLPLGQSAADDYETIIDEECKVRIKTPQSSKFRDTPIDLDDKRRKQHFVEWSEGRERTRAHVVEGFFRATALAWRDYKASQRETVYVGYSPIVGVDGDRMLSDLPDAHLLNIVRNPWSAYGDTKKRPLPLSLAHYMTGWNVHQLAARATAGKYPDRAHIVRYEDIVADPVATLSAVLAKMGVGSSPTLGKPTWNGNVLPQVYPWGTIRTPTVEANRATANELSAAEKAEIRLRTSPLIEAFGYSELA